MEHEALSPAIWLIFYKLYEDEVLEEDSIRSWYNNESAFTKEKEMTLRNRVKELIDWFDTADEESEESD